MPLTVVQVLPALEVGGVERGTVEVAAELARRGHRAVVVSAGGRLVPALERAGAEHVTLDVGRKSPLCLRHVFTLRALLRRANADILHAASRLPAWIACLAWRALPAASRPHFVTSVHGCYRVGRYSRIMTRGERVIAISEFIADYVRTQYPETDPTRVVVIPRGVDTRLYRPGYRPAPAWQMQFFEHQPHLRDAPLVTFPARISRIKGHDHFLDVMRILRERNVEAQGVIVGGAAPGHEGYLQSLERRVREESLEDRVTLLGHRDDLRDILAVSSLVMSLPTRPEAFGRSTLEALALGIPVVGYAHGGTAEVLARLFPQGAVAAGDAVAAADLAERFLRRAPPLEPDNPYTLERMLDDTLSLYTSLANMG